MCILLTGGRNVIVFISIQLKVTMAGDSAAEGRTLGPSPVHPLLSVMALSSHQSQARRTCQSALKASG